METQSARATLFVCLSLSWLLCERTPVSCLAGMPLQALPTACISASVGHSTLYPQGHILLAKT